MRSPHPPAPPIRWQVLRQKWSSLCITFLVAGLVLIIGNKLGFFLSPPSPNASVINQPSVLPTPAGNGSGFVTPPPPPLVRPVPSVTPSALPPDPIATPSAPVPVIPPPDPTPVAPVNTRFGHLPYNEAASRRLGSIGKFVRENYEREEYLDVEAGRAFQIMVDAARSQGVHLMGISGFRSIADQRQLFDRQIERKGSAQAAAKWSAPPGHSEHHTGYAIDIGDVTRDDADIKVKFETTPAYQWLVTNAGQYGFEQSFPRGNAQGVSYEPWHWRYVGTPTAQQIFASARVQ
ncbi:M15 family metallopeptidase [filamentous cyanobacterium LEGE 11480]|uniref:M15 family metallopeptidase n=2 Tax=Romeriopsis TaxID=2992131 RepID=A0A928Z407_9CYAN|nr:M15 family metallopeptidase [Romeriopsis navalis LEGE 11480]